MDKEQRLILSVLEWYRIHPNELRKVVEITERRHDILSLRVIDHFVTKYTCEHHVILPTPNVVGDFFDVFWSYKNNLQCYHKKYFDPFNRVNTTQPQSTPYHKTPQHLTEIYTAMTVSEDGATAEEQQQQKVVIKRLPSLKQLIFFKWAITSGVLDYICAHSAEIEKHMLELEESKRKASK